MSEKQPNGPNTSQWTVAKYLDEIYIPQKRDSCGMTAQTAKWYHVVARKLAEWQGRPVRLRELTDHKLRDFQRWLVDVEGFSAKGAKHYRESLKAVLRHWRPDEHPRIDAANPVRSFLEADVAGTLEQICRDHYLPERPKIGSPQTVKQYGRCLRIFSEFLGHSATLADLTDETIGRFLRHRVDHGAKARTVNGEAKQLKALWNWAAKKRLVDKFPTIGKLPEPEIVPRAWTEAQLASLIAACRKAKGLIEGVDAAGYWLSWHLVQWDSGERTGAMLALTWEMLDFKTGHLTVPAEVRKGGLKAGFYCLKPATLRALENIRQPTRELIFPTPGGAASNFHYRYKLLVLSAGLPWVPHKSGPQKMRRTFASFITAAGGDATAALRHSTRRVTEESYTDPAIASPTPANALLFSLDAKGGAK